MPYEHSSYHDSLFVKNRASGLGNHGRDRPGSYREIISGSGIFSREFRIKVF